MLVEKIVSKRPVSLSQVKEIVKDRLKGKEAEPTYEQDLTIKYVDTFVRLTRAKAEKMVRDLSALEGVDEALAVKIADVLPDKPVILELLLQKKYTLTDEVKKQIIDSVLEHTK